jgi:hypothetical protein
VPDGELSLDPERAVDGARNLTASGKIMGTQRAGIGNQLQGMSAPPPWGNDEIGSAFERQYRGFETTVLDAWTKLAAHLETLGGLAAHTVELNTQADAHASVAFHRTSKQL